MKKTLRYLICLISSLLILPINSIALELVEPVIAVPTYYTLSVEAQGGRVVSEPSGIDCDNTTCTYKFMQNTYIALAAVAGQNYEQIDSLGSWSGDCSSSSSEACRIYMDGDKTVTATFQALGRPVALFNLTVNVGGTGDTVTVVSDPPGINCSATDASCSADFSSNSSVALSAIYQAEFGGIRSTFSNWSGDCSSTTTACVVNMGEANKTVTANYIALVTVPAFALPAPSGANKTYQHPRVEPSVSSSIDIQPFGSGENGADLRVQLPEIAGPVDIYLGISVEGNNDLLLVNSQNNLTFLSNGLVAWKSSHNGSAIDETILTNIPWALLPAGTYNFYLMVTPAGSTADYYLWQSYRNNLQTVTNPFIN